MVCCIRAVNQTCGNPLYLTRFDGCTRLQNRIKDVGLLQARISRLRAEHERTMALCVQEHALLQREVERAERSLQDFHRVVEASYGIDMRRIVYDDVTGRITDSAGFIASEPGKPPVGLAVLW